MSDEKQFQVGDVVRLAPDGLVEMVVVGTEYDASPSRVSAVWHNEQRELKYACLDPRCFVLGRSDSKSDVPTGRAEPFNPET